MDELKHFVALIIGKGCGCDQTIDCNVTFVRFALKDMDSAVDYGVELIDHYGDDRVESIVIVEEANSFEIDVEGEMAEKENEEAERAEYERLKRKFDV